MYHFFVDDRNESLLVDRPFYHVNCNIPFMHEPREDGVPLPTNEELTAYAWESNSGPSIGGLIGTVVNGRFIQPDKVLSGNVAIFCLPYSTKEFVPLCCLFRYFLVE
jgi:hypothetical protein